MKIEAWALNEFWKSSNDLSDQPEAARIGKLRMVREVGIDSQHAKFGVQDESEGSDGPSGEILKGPI